MCKCKEEQKIGNLPVGTVSYLSESNSLRPITKPSSHMDKLKAEFTIATNVKCRISNTNDTDIVLDLIKETCFSQKWNADIGSRLEEVEKQNFNCALFKAKEWDNDCVGLYNKVKECMEELEFFEKEIKFLTEENKPLREFLNLQDQSFFKMINKKDNFECNDGLLVEKIQKRKAHILLLQCTNQELSKMITNCGVTVDAMYQNA